MMSLTLKAAEKGRTDIVRAFRHLADLFAEVPPADSDPVAFMRQQVGRYGCVEPPQLPSGVTVESVVAGGIPCEWILPDGWESGPSARLIYLHGGGWAAGDLDSHRPMIAALAIHLGYPVLAVEYGLAPERPFPAAINDSAATLAWARDNGPAGKARAQLLGLAGDSAGGNIAAAAVVRAIEQGGERPDRLVLLSGSLELTADPARRQIVDPLNDFARQEVQIPGICDLYIQGITTAADPLVSPLRAKDATFAAFPPTLLQVSNCEFLLWDAQEFAGKLIANGVRTSLSVWPDLPHVWQIFPFLPESSAALSEVGNFLAP